MVAFGGRTVEPAVAKLAPWLKFEPMESKKAFRYGKPNSSAMKSMMSRPSEKRPEGEWKKVWPFG